MSSIGMLGTDILESLVSSTRHGSSQKFKQGLPATGAGLAIWQRDTGTSRSHGSSIGHFGRVVCIVFVLSVVHPASDFVGLQPDRAGSAIGQSYSGSI